MSKIDFFHSLICDGQQCKYFKTLKLNKLLDDKSCAINKKTAD